MKRGLWILATVAILLSGCGGGGGSSGYYDDGDYTLELQAYDDEYYTYQNQPIAIPFQDGVLANDYICDCPDFDLDWPPTTASNGSLTGNDDGSFYYAPRPGFVGVDFFEYRIEDNYGSSTAIVRIHVERAPTPVAVVDNGSGSDSTGSVNGSPFATIQQAVLAAGENGIIVVSQGNGTPYAGTVNLLPGQTLVGEDFEDSLFQGLVRPTLTGPINMAAGCTVRGLTLEGGRVNASSVAGGEISQCDFYNVSGYAINLNNTSGEWVVEDNIIEDSGGGLSANLGSNFEMRLLFQYNEVTDSSQSAVRLLASDTSKLTGGFFVNHFFGNLLEESFFAQTSNSATLSLDLEDNQTDGTYRLERLGGTFQVEQLDPLTPDLNTGTVNHSGGVAEVSNGFCGF
ncbi:MAG: Ig-like domain-containing protein [Vulcanimicrobiota bacterium]